MSKCQPDSSKKRSETADACVCFNCHNQEGPTASNSSSFSLPSRALPQLVSKQLTVHTVVSASFCVGFLLFSTGIHGNLILQQNIVSVSIQLCWCENLVIS